MCPLDLNVPLPRFFSQWPFVMQSPCNSRSISFNELQLLHHNRRVMQSWSAEWSNRIGCLTNCNRVTLKSDPVVLDSQSDKF